MDFFLRTFGGIVVVGGFPLVSGYVSFRGYFRMFGSIPRALVYAYAPERWLAVEVAASVVFVFVYGFRRWPLQPGLALLLVGLHFAIWAWFIGGGQFPQILPALGFFCSVTWALYVKQAESHAIPQASVVR